MNHTLFTIAIISVLLLTNCRQGKNHENISSGDSLTYTNPIINKYLADPFMKYEDGYYYLFATGEAEDGRYIPIHRSRDLVTWEFVRGAVEKAGKTDWNYKHFWAPEVLKINNKYYLYYTASPEESPDNAGNRVGLATADSIHGPYQNFGVIIPNSSIDGHPVFDKDSNLYIFYTTDWHNSGGLQAGQIFVDKMISPTQVSGNPVQLISHHDWQEGPFLLQKDCVYYLTYSCGNYRDSTYHIRYAKAEKILGPYIEQPDTIMKSNEIVKGPGHHSLFNDKDGNNWIVYHGWDTAYTARYPRVDRFSIMEGKINSNGPTYTRQIIE